MASIRTLKKDAQALIKEVIDDCGNVILLHPDKKDETMKLIDNALNTYSNCIDKINGGAGQKKAYFTEIMNEMLKCADDTYEQLRNIINTK